MSYGVEVSRSALKGLASLPPEVGRRFAARIEALADDPRPPGTRSLKGDMEGLRRLRVGDYRAIYHVNDDERTIAILRVGHRGSVYR